MKLRPQFLPRWGPPLLWDVLRGVRNACAEGMTHHTNWISAEAQEHYRVTYSENVRHFLYWDPDGCIAAFSRLEWRDGYVYPTYGVVPSQRGKGYAWEVVKHTMLAAGGPLKGDLLADNEAIKKVDYALGWVPVGEPHDGIQDVEAAWPPQFYLDAEANEQCLLHIREIPEVAKVIAEYWEKHL